MGTNNSAENTPNAPEFICPICLPKPKSSVFRSFILPLLIFFSPSLIYIRVHRIDVKEREDPADCLDNDLQQIFGSVISPDLEIMKQEEEKLEGHCRSLLCFVCSTVLKQQYGPEKMTARRGNNAMNEKTICFSYRKYNFLLEFLCHLFCREEKLM